jgi:hypothetical protein
VLYFQLVFSQPKDNSSADSSGVPHTRQITAEQSPHTSGSLTARAQVGHHKLASLAFSGTLEEGSDIEFQASTRIIE